MLDTEHIAKRFYRTYKAEHAGFFAALQGLPDETACLTYADLMLHRLMVLYFLQQNGFLDGDVDYLHHHLLSTQKHAGKDLFYHSCLLPLFYEQLCRYYCPMQFAIRLFQKHELELSASIQIPDSAFERLFTFFDGYRWRLDGDRSQASNELYPEILAYIFEQGINRKEKGVYYTSRDVAEYITERTILPYFFTTIKEQFSHVFGSDAPLWQLLQTVPDRYIRAAVKHPAYLAGESEREYKERRTYYAQLQSRLQSGQIRTIDSFITYNLDLRQFALDSIATCEQAELLLNIYMALEQATILDPTCGSGAFLLTALTLLETLYTACLDRMHIVIGQQTHSAAKQKPVDQEHVAAYQSLLSCINQYPNQACFIVSTIILHNLHGVDLMEEATELCKLCLFLAQLRYITPAQGRSWQQLPATRYNILTGNALVGYVHKKDAVLTSGNTKLPGRQEMLDDQPVASQDIDEPHFSDNSGYMKPIQRRDHQPFHWFANFPAALARGGFDVIIGNPPYVEYSKVRQVYQIYGYETESCGNLYAAVIERSLALSRKGGYLGLIVPLSICGGERFEQLRTTIRKNTGHIWLANFEIFPSRLFDGAFQRLSILLAQYGHISHCNAYVTKIRRWYAIERPHLIDLITYTPTTAMLRPSVFPKLAAPLQENIVRKMLERAPGSTLAKALFPRQTNHFVYYQEATNYWMKTVCRVPFYRKNGEVMEPPHGRFLYFNDACIARTVMAVMNSSLFYVWFATYSDGFHLSHALVKDFPIDDGLFTIQELPTLSLRLEADIQLYATRSTRNTKSGKGANREGHQIELEEYHMSRSKPIIDEIDAILAQHYRFTSEELAFIVNYDGKYRMG